MEQGGKELVTYLLLLNVMSVIILSEVNERLCSFLFTVKPIHSERRESKNLTATISTQS